MYRIKKIQVAVIGVIIVAGVFTAVTQATLSSGKNKKVKQAVVFVSLKNAKFHFVSVCPLFPLFTSYAVTL